MPRLLPPLTDRQVKTFKPPEGIAQADLFDGACAGLSIRVTQGGKRTWNFNFTHGAQRGRVKLGTYPALSLQDAREQALNARRHVELGRDPRQIEDQQPSDMKRLVEDRLRIAVQERVDPRTGKKTPLKSAAEIERRYNKEILPEVGDVAVKDFRIAHLNKVIDPIMAQGSTRVAGAVFHDLQALLNFAVGQGIIEYNPVAKATFRGSKGAERQRFLSLSEIRTLWNGISNALDQSEHVPQIIKLCLITGQRVGEVAGMRKQELDLANNIWTIPAGKTKNGDEHAVPLPAMAVEIILDAMDGAKDYLFTNNEGEAFDRNAVTRAVGRMNAPTDEHPLGELGIPKWTPHDLRRTVSTHMSLEENGLKIPELHIGHVLNHRSQTRKTITQRVYNRNTYLAEKRDALEKWAAFLKKVIAQP